MDCVLYKINWTIFAPLLKKAEKSSETKIGKHLTPMAWKKIAVVLLTLAASMLHAGTLSASSDANGTDTGKKRMSYMGFLGGMMIHTGYVWSNQFQVTSPAGTNTMSMSGAPVGVGGSIRFMFGKHLRVGGEGYVSNLTYGEHRSHAKTGWGGLLADCAWDFKGWRFFIGGTVGGGSQTNTTLLAPIDDDYKTENVSYRKYGFAALAPFLGVEVPVTSKINFVAKLDWLFNVSNPQDDFVTGPRIYLGILFGHRK